MTTTQPFQQTPDHGCTWTPPRRPGDGYAPPRRPRWHLRVAAGLAAVTMAAGLGVAAAQFAHSAPRVQAIADAGAHPFMSPVGTDRAGVVSLPAMAGPQSGDLAGLYAQDPRDLPCDAAALLSNLQADPARAAAWGAVLGVAPERIEGYVQSLTAVTLRSDTAVVDHGYVDGTFEPNPMVLAAGTAVFIDGYGAPTVRCVSGNPLTPGTSGDPAVTVVTPVAVPMTVTVLHHPVTNHTHQHQNTHHSGTPSQDAPGGHVSGVFVYDGSVLLSDGRLVRPDGTVVTLPAPPAGTTPLPGGGYLSADGLYAYNADGSPRSAINIQSGLYVQPDCTFEDYQGNPVTPGPNFSYQWNYDGTISAIYDGPGEPDDVNDNITVWDASGTIVSGANGVYDPATGSILDENGKRQNHTGTERTAVELPGGEVLGADEGVIDLPGPNAPAVPAGGQPAPKEMPAPAAADPAADDVVVDDGAEEPAVDDTTTPDADASTDAPTDAEDGGDEAATDGS